MSDDEKRLDFLTYYRAKLQSIIEKLDKQIAKLSSDAKPREPNPAQLPGLEEEFKDLTDRQFLETFVQHEGVIEALDEFRGFLNAFSTERKEDGRLYYSNDKLGNRFAMVAASPKWVNLYISPRLGLYDRLPEDAFKEVRFGKSTGDRWDKFQISSAYQARKALSYLKGFLAAESLGGQTKASEGQKSAR